MPARPGGSAPPGAAPTGSYPWYLIRCRPVLVDQLRQVHRQDQNPFLIETLFEL